MFNSSLFQDVFCLIYSSSALAEDDLEAPSKQEAFVGQLI